MDALLAVRVVSQPPTEGGGESYDLAGRIDVELLNVASHGDWVLSERIDDHIVGDKHMCLPVMNAARFEGGRITLFRDYYCRKTVAELGMG